jgi:hypothetical protein
MGSAFTIFGVGFEDYSLGCRVQDLGSVTYSLARCVCGGWGFRV